MLLLRRRADRSWTVEALTRELRGSPGIVTSALSQLGKAKLVAPIDGLYRYHAASPALDALVERVAASYGTFPFAVTQAILAAPNHKIQLFADAFRLKRE